jgi:hypothetical protein
MPPAAFIRDDHLAVPAGMEGTVFPFARQRLSRGAFLDPAFADAAVGVAREMDDAAIAGTYG